VPASTTTVKPIANPATPVINRLTITAVSVRPAIPPVHGKVPASTTTVKPIANPVTPAINRLTTTAVSVHNATPRITGTGILVTMGKPIAKPVMRMIGLVNMMMDNVPNVITPRIGMQTMTMKMTVNTALWTCPTKNLQQIFICLWNASPVIAMDKSLLESCHLCHSLLCGRSF
jgi:hypothetical protein